MEVVRHLANRLEVRELFRPTPPPSYPIFYGRYASVTCVHRECACPFLCLFPPFFYSTSCEYRRATAILSSCLTVCKRTFRAGDAEIGHRQSVFGEVTRIGGHIPYCIFFYPFFPYTILTFFFFFFFYYYIVIVIIYFYALLFSACYAILSSHRLVFLLEQKLVRVT